MNPISPRKKALFVAVLFGGSVFVALLAAEIFIRLTRPYTTPAFVAERSLQYEDARFSRSALAQREHIWYVGPAKRTPRASINSMGYRGPEFGVEKPAGTVRVMIYGGSAVFDVKASQGQDWPRRLELDLRDRGFPVEVINAGVPGHASADALGRFFAEGHLFEPDIVVLYNAWNDIRDFRRSEALLRQTAPRVIDPRIGYTGWVDKLLCNTSQLYVRLRGRYHTARLGIGLEGAERGDALTDRLSDAALRQYRLNLQLFVDAARNVGAVPILTTQGRLVAADNTPAERETIAYKIPLLTHEALVRAFEETDAIVREVAASKGVILVDAEAVQERDWFYDHVHTTERGSEGLARVVADGLEPVLRERLEERVAVGSGTALPGSPSSR